ncbi:MAG TPA: antibiotic biosynthesis monooxygenase family protein [Candidatus Brocadiales bacterium]|nr:antibiotic biosynthesis monooxygenase family protein [Candidatus Brocadiales bacterium]
MSITSLFRIEVKPEEEKNFLTDFTTLLPVAKKQKGFRNAEAFTPLGSKYTYLLITEWDSEADIEAWKKVEQHMMIMAKAGRYVANHSIKRYKS